MFARRAAAPAAALVLLIVAAGIYHRDHVDYLRLLTAWGFHPFRHPFLDWANMGAFVHCWREGVNVYLTDPCDALGRTFSYSPLWLRFTFLPDGPGWRVGLGLAIDVGFIAALPLVLKPADRRETFLAVLAAISTDAVYAAERANVDLIIFILAAIAAALAARGLRARMAGYATIFVAGLLKYYPFVALVSALRETPRRLALIAGLSLAGLTAFAFAFAGELAMAARNIPKPNFASDSFGASNLPTGLAAFAGAPPFSPDIDRSPVWVASFVALTATCVWLGVRAALRPGLRVAFEKITPADEAVLVTGALILAGCFFAGQSIEYRGVFLIFAMAGLTSLSRRAEPSAARSLATASAAALALMWEGLARMALDRGPAVLRALFWFARELLWWWLISWLLAVLLVFAWRSPAGRWLSGRPESRSSPH